jgi:hypothetical protein
VGAPAELNAIDPNVAVSLADDGITVRYSLRQASLRQTVPYSGYSTNEDDQIIVYLGKPGTNGAVLTVSVNPKGSCSSVSSIPSQRFVHNQCTATAKVFTPPNSLAACGTKFCWSGTVTISFEALRVNGLLDLDPKSGSSLRLLVGRTLWGESCSAKERNRCFGTYFSAPSFEAYGDWLHVRFSLRNDVSGEQYISGAGTFGNVSGSPPHRITTTALLPYAPGDALSLTVADASGTALTMRDAALASVLPADQVKTYKCVSCGSFQTDLLSAAWKPAINTQSTLGVDYSKLGVDTEPFNFDAVGYAVDSGLRLVDSQSFATLAVAAMRGTTQTAGVAADSVFDATFPIPDRGAGALSLGLSHVAANRSQLSSAAGTTGLLPEPPERSVNTEGTLAYNLQSGTDFPGYSGFTMGEQSTFAALIRYGTQYVPGGNRLDIAASTQLQPGYAKYATNHQVDNWVFSGGYRSLGPRWYPIDADFDPLLGLHGFYGSVQFSQPPAAHAFTASLAAHRFSDTIEARDASLSGAISLGLAKYLSATASFATASLAVSQTARLVNYAGPLTPVQGQQYLPNSTYSVGLAYSHDSVEANLGYSSGEAQNCGAPSSVASGCYAYRQPSFTGGIFVQPQGLPFFFDVSIENQNNDALNLPSTTWNALQNAWIPQQTTATHIVRQGAVGLFIPGLPCSTATFTSVNRGGQYDTFAASPPQPGFTNTYALDIVPPKWGASILAGYSRQGGPTPPATATSLLTNQPPSQFFIRLTVGLPTKAFVKRQNAACNNS